jgi:hypothetical protein
MNLTARDRLLAMLLPALLIIAGYGWFWLSPTQSELARAVKARDAAEEAYPKLQQQVKQAQAQFRGLTAEVQRLEAEKQKALLAWQAAAGRCADPHLRIERIERLNAVLSRRGLRLMEDAEADAKDGKVGAALDSLATQMAALGAGPKPEVRRVRIVGRYVDVLAALEDLAKGDVVAIPVGLVMKEAGLTGETREWALMVWI